MNSLAEKPPLVTIRYRDIPIWPEAWDDPGVRFCLVLLWGICTFAIGYELGVGL